MNNVACEFQHLLQIKTDNDKGIDLISDAKTAGTENQAQSRRNDHTRLYAQLGCDSENACMIVAKSTMRRCCSLLRGEIECGLE